MNANLLTQLLIAIIPSVLTGVGSLFISVKKCKNEVRSLETNNRHEIEKLMKQHEIDIDNLKEKHRLDLEVKEKEHQLKLEEIKVQNEQEIIKKEKELYNSTMYSIMGNVTKDFIFSSEMKEEINKKIKEGFKKN